MTTGTQQIHVYSPEMESQVNLSAEIIAELAKSPVVIIHALCSSRLVRKTYKNETRVGEDGVKKEVQVPITEIVAPINENEAEKYISRGGPVGRFTQMPPKDRRVLARHILAQLKIERPQDVDETLFLNAVVKVIGRVLLLAYQNREEGVTNFDDENRPAFHYVSPQES
ncbi:MAG: hypothetical protein JNK26_02275 [Candidatus Doudnabacteria bacterium]|nr:hypothetical protein [Candidatus Doudnabacteria bacterium]